MILQRKIFEKLKPSFHLTRSKPNRFQPLHEDTHELNANRCNKNEIGKQRLKQVPFEQLHGNTHQVNAKVTTENQNRYGERNEIAIRGQLKNTDIFAAQCEDGARDVRVHYLTPVTSSDCTTK